MKFADKNQNGIKDEGELGIADYTIQLCPAIAILDGGCLETQTDENGIYSFTGVLPGDYVVSEVLKAGDTQTFPTESDGTYPIELDGEGIAGLDFGNFNPSMLPAQSAPHVSYSRGLKQYAYRCEAALAETAPTVELRLSPGGATLIFKGTGESDGFIVWDPQGGERSDRPDCTGMEWWNDHCTELRRYGYDPQVEVVNPHGKIRWLDAAEESSTSGIPAGTTATPRTFTITNQYTGAVYFKETTNKDVFDTTFVVVDDLTGCIIKPQLIGVWGDWIPALPPTLPPG